MVSEPWLSADEIAEAVSFWTAVDFTTGETKWKQLAGTGLGFNNHYAGMVLGRRTHMLYLGVIGGVAAMRDGK